MSKKVKSFQTIFKELELMHEMNNAEVINCIIVAFFQTGFNTLLTGY